MLVAASVGQSYPEPSALPAWRRSGLVSRALRVAGDASVALTLLCLGYFVLSDPNWIGWDAAAYMHWGLEITRGKLPFVDIVDINPPLVQFVHVLPAWFSRLTGLGPAQAFNLWVWAWAVASSLVVRSLLTRYTPRLTLARQVAFSFAFAFSSHIAWHQGHFGQREHFLVMILVPALLLRWARHEQRELPRALAIAVGVCAATALAIKPQYLPACLLFEGALWLRHRDLRRALGVELLGFVFVGLGYAALFLAFPVMRREFFGFYLPLFARGYRAYDCSLRDLLVLAELWVALALLLLCGVFLAQAALPARAREARLPEPAIALPFALFVVGSLLAYLGQHKGWPYQIFPAFTLAPLALVLAAPIDGFLSLAAAILGLTLSIREYTGAVRGTLPQEGWLLELRQLVGSTARPGDRVQFIGASALGPYPMLLDLGLRPGSRFPWLQALPMFYPTDSSSTACEFRVWGAGRPAEQRVLDYLRQDFRRAPPSLVIAETFEGQTMRPGCTPRGWLEHSGFLEREMAEYDQIGNMYGFAIWRRRGAVP